MKVMTLNIGRYDGNWAKKKRKISAVVNKEKPDIIFMQEVFDDRRHQAKDGLNQGEQLNTQLNYKNFIYDVVEQVMIENGKEVTSLAFDGLLCLTNLQIIARRVLRLERQMQDKHHRAVQIVRVRYGGKDVLFYNVHYSPNDEWSRRYLKETKGRFIGEKQAPIIIGDFNILDSRTIKEILGKGFESSYDAKRYVSFPSKGQVLDYIVIPQRRYRFVNVKCGYDCGSNHLPLIAEIEMKA